MSAVDLDAYRRSAPGPAGLRRDHYARMTGRSMRELALWDLFSAYLGERARR